MFGLRRTLSSGALAGVAALALLVVASAPAASGRSSESRSFLTGAHARGQPHALEWVKTTALPRGKWSSDDTSASVDGKVRVVIEAHDVAAARANVLAVGGRVERTAEGLVQALVDPHDLNALERRPSIDRVRAPFTRIEHAVNGEEVYATL